MSTILKEFKVSIRIITEPYNRIWPCVKWVKWTSNVDYDRTYKEHRNLKIRKHVTTFCSGTKPFNQLWVKGFDIRRRDTIFYAILFIWPPYRAAPIGRTFASRLRAPKVDSSRFASSTRLWLFKFSHKPPCASGAWRHPHPVTSVRFGLLWYLSDTSIHPRPAALTPASMLHLTNPCAEPKGSQPN